MKSFGHRLNDAVLDEETVYSYEIKLVVVDAVYNYFKVINPYFVVLNNFGTGHLSNCVDLPQRIFVDDEI